MKRILSPCILISSTSTDNIQVGHNVYTKIKTSSDTRFLFWESISECFTLFMSENCPVKGLPLVYSFNLTKAHLPSFQTFLSINFILCDEIVRDWRLLLSHTIGSLVEKESSCHTSSHNLERNVWGSDFRLWTTVRTGG